MIKSILMYLMDFNQLAILVPLTIMEDCVFCKIINKEIPAEFVKETETMAVFKDNHPKAPIHLLIVPKKHYKDITEADGEVWEEVRNLAVEIAKEKGVGGFRLAHNAGSAAIVPHMHVHFLGEINMDREI